MTQIFFFIVFIYFLFLFLGIVPNIPGGTTSARPERMTCGRSESISKEFIRCERRPETHTGRDTDFTKRTDEQKIGRARIGSLESDLQFRSFSGKT